MRPALPIAIDLFAGPGGWSLACQKLGIEEYGVERDKAACETRSAAGFKTIWDDVSTMGTTQDHNLLIASPPCQTFSAAGKGTGRAALDVVLEQVERFDPLAGMLNWPTYQELTALTGDERTALIIEPLRVALTNLPDYIAFEQVPTVLPVWEAMAEVLQGWGWNTWTGLLHAEQYGVPQTRKRAILMARRGSPVGPPTPTHSKYYPRDPERLDPGVKPWVSMAEALQWGMDARPSYTVTGGGTETGGAEVFGRRAREAMGDVRTGKGTIRDTDKPAPTLTSSMDNGNYQWTHRRPSTTIVGSFKPEIVAAPGYRTTVSRQNAPDSVRVTVEEAGILQSFPADFPWQGSKTKKYQQVGNAIPPLLAQAILEELIKQ